MNPHKFNETLGQLDKMDMKRFPALRLATAKWQIHTIQAQIVGKGVHKNTNTNSL